MSASKRPIVRLFAEPIPSNGIKIRFSLGAFSCSYKLARNKCKSLPESITAVTFFQQIITVLYVFLSSDLVKSTRAFAFIFSGFLIVYLLVSQLDAT